MNGNVSVSYTDAVATTLGLKGTALEQALKGNESALGEDGIVLRVVRTYNSKTPFRGMFGWGWGGPFDTFLEVMGDGSVNVHESGGGMENIFSPPSFSSTELDIAIERIVSTSVLAGLVPDARRDSYRQRLRTDIFFRNDEWTKLVRQRLLPPRQVREGTELLSRRWSYSTLKKTADGYERRLNNDSTVESFNDAGKLVRRSEPGRGTIRLSYDPRGHLQEITTDDGRRLRFTTNSRGLVVRVLQDDGRAATYRYDAFDNMIDMTDSGGERFRHEYDPRHNLTRTIYADGRSVQIAYHPRSLYENVRSIRWRDGSRTTYDYDLARRDSGTVRVTLREYDPAGALRSTAGYRFEEATTPTGVRYTRQLERMLGADTVVNTFHEPCLLPTAVARPRDTTTVEYDSSCRIVRKETAERIDSVGYDPVTGNASHVVTISKPGLARSRVDLRYDSAGRLTSAADGDSVSVSVSYDDQGRITRLARGGSALTARYDSASALAELGLPDLGTLAVRYDRTGAVAGVDPAITQPAVAGQGIVDHLQLLLQASRVSVSFVCWCNPTGSPRVAGDPEGGRAAREMQDRLDPIRRVLGHLPAPPSR